MLDKQNHLPTISWNKETSPAALPTSKKANLYFFKHVFLLFINITHTEHGEPEKELKGMFIVQPTTSLYGVWIPKWKHAEGNP